MRSRIFRALLRFIRFTLIAAGVVFMFLILMALTSRPFYTHHWLGTGIEQNCPAPDMIVMLGAAGMPGGTNLIRLHYTAQAYHKHPHSVVYLSHPDDISDSNSSLIQMAEELMLRGVPHQKIRILPEGRNTRAQALEFFENSGSEDEAKCVMLVTSPGHMRRSVMAFRKAGIYHVIPLPAFEIPFEGELRYDEDLGGERRGLAPDTSQTLSMRYEFWTQMHYQLVIIREFMALAYYWVRGWI